MRIVELLNAGADADPPSGQDVPDDQRAFGQLLVTGAASRFLRLAGPATDAAKDAGDGLRGPLAACKAAAGEADDNPLYLLLRATQEAVEKDKRRVKGEEEEEEAPVDAQERGRRQRRAKQRVVFRRCYYKKIDTLTALRTEHGELQAALAALLARHKAPRGSRQTADATRDRFVALVEEKEALRGQRGLLADAATAQAKTRDTLQWLVDAEVKAIAAGERVAPLPADVLDAPPMTKAEAASLASDMRAWRLQRRQDGVLERVDVDDAVFGWRTRCSAVRDGLCRVWTSSKRVETDDTPLALCRRSLAVLTRHRDTKHEPKAERVALLAPWTGAEVATVQTIDADHVLLHVNGSGLFLCACEPEDGDGCVLSIQPVEWATAGDRGTKTSMGQFRSAAGDAARCWVSVDQQRRKRRRGDCGAEATACEVAIHYAVPATDSTSGRALAIEAARASCQWETRVVGGLLGLGGSRSSSSSCSPSSSPPTA